MESIRTVNKKRVTLIGPIASGKTTLFHRLKGDYSFVSGCASIGIDFSNINLSFNNKQYPVQLFDTSGRKCTFPITARYIKTADLILLLFREETMQQVTEDFYPLYIKHRKESSKLIFVEDGVKEENQCKLTERQKQLFLEKVKQNYEYYIQIDCRAIYNIDTLKELIASHVFDYYDNYYIVIRKRKKIIGKGSITLRTQKNKKINTSCV